MTNSEANEPSETTGTPETTSLDTGRYVSDKGTPFKIEQLPNNLYRIVMLKGGKAPSICEGRYTSYNFAQRELVKYLRQGNRLGDAVYPKLIGR